MNPHTECHIFITVYTFCIVFKGERQGNASYFSISQESKRAYVCPAKVVRLHKVFIENGEVI
jgi:hypothetical protein